MLTSPMTIAIRFGSPSVSGSVYRGVAERDVRTSQVSVCVSVTATAQIPSTSGTLLHNHLSPLPVLSLCGRSRCEANETETDYRYLRT
jgi:hypothetical protein